MTTDLKAALQKATTTVRSLTEVPDRSEHIKDMVEKCQKVWNFALNAKRLVKSRHHDTQQGNVAVIECYCWLFKNRNIGSLI